MGAQQSHTLTHTHTYTWKKKMHRQFTRTGQQLLVRGVHGGGGVGRGALVLGKQRVFCARALRDGVDARNNPRLLVLLRRVRGGADTLGVRGDGDKVLSERGLEFGDACLHARDVLRLERRKHARDRRENRGHLGRDLGEEKGVEMQQKKTSVRRERACHAVGDGLKKQHQSEAKQQQSFFAP